MSIASKLSVSESAKQSQDLKVTPRSLNLLVTVPELNLKLPLEIARTTIAVETSGWLLQKIHSLLINTCSNSKTSLDWLSSLIGLKTNTSELHIDYLLSLPEQNLSFLRDGLVIRPIFCRQNYSSLDTLEPKLTLDDLEIIAKIGEGGFSRVYLVRMKSNNRYYALKQISKLKESEAQIGSYLLEERNILAAIEGDHVVKLHFAFQTQDFCYFGLDFVPCGDLLALKYRAQKFQESEARFFVSQLLLALDELHSKKIIYRDLKLENLLVDQDGYIKLCDFGLSTMINDQKPFRPSLCGTPQFMSPEMISKKGYDYKTDYFSLGIVLFEMVAGYLPFDHANVNQLFYMIQYKGLQLPDDFSPELKDFVSKLLCKDPAKRLGSNGGIKEILSHPWLKEYDIRDVKEKRIRLPWILQPTTRTLRRFTTKLDIEAIAMEKKTNTQKPKTATLLRCFSFASDSSLHWSSKSTLSQLSLKKIKSTFDEETLYPAEQTDHDAYLDEICFVEELPTNSLAQSKMPHPSKNRDRLVSEIFYEFEDDN